MNLQQLYQWQEQVATTFSGLGAWQAKGLALFSVGVVLAERCTLSKVAEKLGQVGKADTLERRLQRWLSNPRIDDASMSESWIGWVLREFGQREVVLLVDETKLSDRLSAMVVGLAYEQNCIPLAWQCYQQDAYPAVGQVQLIQALLEQVVRQVSEAKQVLVQVDRGLGTSPRLVEAVARLGVRFLFRVQGTTRFRDATGEERALKSHAQRGETWSACGDVFKKHGWLTAQVRVIQEEGYEDVWCLVTNDPTLVGSEYAQRYWQEVSFRDLKSDGWHWQRSQVCHPAHAHRLLLVLALAFAWTLTHGTLALAIPALISRGKRQVFSRFRQGLRYIAYLLTTQQPLYLGLLFFPDTEASKTVVT